MPVERLLLVRQQLPRPSDGTCLIAEVIEHKSEWLASIASPTIVAFSIEYETGSDDWERCYILMYSSTDEFLGEDYGPRPFLGRKTETLRFQRGDVVLYLTREATCTLRQGMVLGVPLSPDRVADITADPYAAHPDDTDDTYTVYSLGDTDGKHDHLPECYIWGKKT